jgi:predicted naringenin-chalcone synthase
VPQSIATNGTSPDIPELPETFKNILADPRGDTLDVRLALYERVVNEFLDRAYKDVVSAPDHMIHVTCAGYLSPSPVQKMVSGRNWLNTTVTHSYHMGCYGAFPAVRMAVGFIAASYFSLPRPVKQVDLLHTEFLSIHLDALKHTPGHIVNMTLFADGFIKYSAYPQDEAAKRGLRGLKILSAQEDILPDSLDEMTWTPGPYQFDMYLSKYVPVRIQDAIMPFVTSLCDQADVDLGTEKGQMMFAIHPGGPKILDYVRDQLGIEERQVQSCRRILYEHGNMSSATIPHVWKDIVNANEIPIGTKVVSMAFGPGLTATGLLLEKV